MKELIKLNETEMMVANIKVTIYEVAKMYGIRHDNALRDFKTELAKLSKDELKFHAPQIEGLQIDVKRGDRNGTQSIATKEISLETAVWFFTKYDASLRHKIVRYAFGKLHDTTKLLEKVNSKLQKENNKMRVDKFVEYDDGYQSMSRIIKSNFPDMNVSDAFNILEELGHIETREHKTITREPLDLDVARSGKVVRYNASEIIDILEHELR